MLSSESRKLLACIWTFDVSHQQIRSCRCWQLIETEIGTNSNEAIISRDTHSILINNLLVGDFPCLRSSVMNHAVMMADDWWFYVAGKQAVCLCWWEKISSSFRCWKFSIYELVASFICKIYRKILFWTSFAEIFRAFGFVFCASWVLQQEFRKSLLIWKGLTVPQAHWSRKKVPL